MSRAERENILKRALVTQPYFAKLVFDLVAGSDLTPEYASKLEVNRDFYITDLQSNFGEIFTDIASYFAASLYTGYQKGIYRYDAQQLLPTSFQMYEARYDTPVVNEKGDDRQREIFPRLVPNGDKVYSTIKNLSAKGQDAEAIICLKGFQLQPQVFIDGRTYGNLTESLNRPIAFDYFKFNVNSDGANQTKQIENDNFPRLILGFAARNTTADKSKVSQSKLLIRDITRQLQFNDEPIPLEFFAPRLTCLADEHIYMLPVEYYFQPFAKLQFILDNVSPDTDNKSGYEFSILTRTI